MSDEKPYTMLLFFKRNPKLSSTEFREYYEAEHVPMVMKIAEKAEGLLVYKRRYLNHEDSDPSQLNPFTVFGQPASSVPYDIVNEVTFQNKQCASAFSKMMYDDAENTPKVLRDEETLFVRNEMRGMVVETLGS